MDRTEETLECFPWVSSSLRFAKRNPGQALAGLVALLFIVWMLSVGFLTRRAEVSDPTSEDVLEAAEESGETTHAELHGWGNATADIVLGDQLNAMIRDPVMGGIASAIIGEAVHEARSYHHYTTVDPNKETTDWDVDAHGHTREAHSVIEGFHYYQIPRGGQWYCMLCLKHGRPNGRPGALRQDQWCFGNRELNTGCCDDCIHCFGEVACRTELIQDFEKMDKIIRETASSSGEAARLANATYKQRTATDAEACVPDSHGRHQSNTIEEL